MDFQAKVKLSRQVIIIAGIFCAFTAFLLLLNFAHMKQNKPLESVALKALVDRLATDPNNEELKQEIRNLDLLARRAYFISQWQVKTGAYLLICGMIIFTTALWFYYKLQSKIERPVISEQNVILERIVSRRWILAGGVSFILLALVASFLSNDYLELYRSDSSNDIQNPVQTGEKVEVITIVKKDTTGNIAPSEKTGNQTLNQPVQSSPVLSQQTTVAGNSSLKASAYMSFEDLKKQHNSFRGPFGQGVSYRKNIPTVWDGPTGRNIIWKVPVNEPGFNSPVIWDDKIFLSGGVEGSLFVYCFDLKTGKLNWEKQVTGIEGSPARAPDVSEETGLAAPSVAVDGKAVYAIFATGDLITFDFTGNRLWARNLGIPDNHYGYSSSLIVWNGKLFVQYDSNRGGRLIAINTVNGQSVWDIKKDNKISWASPILIQLNNTYQIVTASLPMAGGYDVETGKELWKIDCIDGGEPAPSPAFSDGIVYTCTEYTKLAAVQVGESPKIIWESNEYLPDASSPVASQGLLFLATTYGVVVCYDAKTGQKYWDHETGGKGFYSSPVIADGKVYVIDLGGKMYIFKLGKQKVIVGEPILGENAFATPAFTDGRIYLRGQKNLYCIGNK